MSFKRSIILILPKQELVDVIMGDDVVSRTHEVFKLVFDVMN